MPRPRRALTLVELLVVVAVLGILVAMLLPMVVRTHQQAIKHRCASHMAQIHTGIELARNQRAGRLPQCLELKPGTDEVDEAHWWYRILARILYPHDAEYDQLTVPRIRDEWWKNNPGRNLQPFPPDGFCITCPASADYHDDTSAPPSVPRCYELDKDRVYDDHYGYNVFGFDYSPSVRTIGLPDGPDAIATSYLYHRPNASGLGGREPMEAIRGQFVDTPTTTHIGAVPDVADPAATILLMDYIKADAQPFPGVDGLHGYRFRHVGQANVLFVDGHVQSYHRSTFLSRVGSPTLHWQVRRP